MAEIATYQCTNYRCKLTVRLCKDFPVWRADAPKKGRSVAPGADLEPFVARYRSEIFCHHCRRVIPDATSLSCDRCGQTDLHDDQTNRQCVQCRSGSFRMVALVVR